MLLRRALVCCALVMFCLAMAVGCTPSVDSAPTSGMGAGDCCAKDAPGVTTVAGQPSPSVTVPLERPLPSVTVPQESW